MARKNPVFMQQERRRWCKVGIVIIISVSVVTSVVTTKILATHYFKIVDGYVRNICDATTKSNERTLSTIRRSLQNSGQGE